MKNVVVAGGSSGIGAAVVRQLVQEGCNVVFSYCSSNYKALKLIEEMKRDDLILQAFKMDVRSKESVQSFTEAVEDVFNKISGIVYSSGIVKDQAFITMAGEQFREVLDVNLFGCYQVIHGLFPLLDLKNGAGIVAVSSTGGIRPDAGQTNYAASKAGMIGMMESLAREYAKKRIRANVVAPGFINTDMVDKENRKIQKSIEEIPMGRLGEPEEVAKAVCFLLGDDASYITAQTLIVDGGRL